MKKLFVLIAVIAVSATTASAQWGIGGRVGNNVQVVGHYVFDDVNYLEARLGMGFIGGLGLDVSALYNWNLKNWDWTPGNWFLDAGVGANIGVNKNYLFVGAQGMCKFGYTFEDFPLSLAVDFSPVVGPQIALNDNPGINTGFNTWGLFSGWGLSCVYRF